MASKIQLRNDTQLNWQNVNPTLLQGELGIEIDTKRIKIGDGTTQWNNLPYDFNINKLSNVLYVGASGDFPTIKSAIDYLSINGNMLNPYSIFLDAGEHSIDDTVTINLPYNLVIRGYSSEVTNVIAVTGLTNKPMFNCLSACDFYNISFNGTTLSNYGNLSTENAINYSNSTYVEVQNSIFNGFYKHVNITGNNSLWFFNSNCNNPINSAISVDSTSATIIDVEANTFENCPVSIKLNSSSSGNFTIMDNLFENASAGQIGVLYNPANYTVDNFSTFVNNKYNNVGLLYSGFDFTRSDGRDANIYMINNQGVEDKSPYFKANVLNNTLTTTINTAGTFYKANFVQSMAYKSKYTVANNRYTYQSLNKGDIVIMCTGSISANANSRTVQIGLMVNNSGNIIDPISLYLPTAGKEEIFTFISYIESLGANDYIEVWVTSSTNGDVLTVNDLNIIGYIK